MAAAIGWPRPLRGTAEFATSPERTGLLRPHSGRIRQPTVLKAVGIALDAVPGRHRYPGAAIEHGMLATSLEEPPMDDPDQGGRSKRLEAEHSLTSSEGLFRLSMNSVQE
jgi:hypothetical protein